MNRIFVIWIYCTIMQADNDKNSNTYKTGG